MPGSLKIPHEVKQQAEIKIDRGEVLLIQRDIMLNFYLMSGFAIPEKDEHQNHVACTFITEMFLNALRCGAGPESKAAIGSMVGYIDWEPKSVGLVAKRIIDDIDDKEKTYELQWASKIYISADYLPCAEFEKDSLYLFNNHVERVDFTDENLVENMNHWFSLKVKNIPGPIVDYSDFNGIYEFKIMAYQAVYFKCLWHLPMSDVAESSIRQEDFRTPTHVVKAKMIKCTNYFDLGQSRFLPDVQILRIPIDQNVALFIVLIDEEKKDKLGEIKKLLYGFFTDQDIDYTRELVELRMPKFTIGCKIDYRNIHLQSKKGKIYHKKSSDFSGIAEGGENLYLNASFQTAVVNFDADLNNEDSSITITHKSDLPPIKFICNRPFLFYITVKDIHVFTGRVTDPTSPKIEIIK